MTRRSRSTWTRHCADSANADVLVCDTSGLLAFFDAHDAHHAAVTGCIHAEPGPFIVSPYVVAELDHLLATRHGVRAELAALEELAGGAWELAGIGPNDLRAAGEVIERYEDQAIGAADASLVVLAGRYRTNRVLTLDRRHFSVLRTITGRRFNVFPTGA